MKSYIQFLKKSSAIRSVVRSYRNAFGQPNWKKIQGLTTLQNVGNGDRNILFCIGGGGYTSGTHIESMLSIAMMQRGFRAHVLLCDGVLPACLQSTLDWERNEKNFAINGPPCLHCISCFKPAEHMYETVGSIVHKISDFLTMEDRNDISKIVESLESDAIKTFVYDGIPVGEHAYAGTLRFYAKAELTDPYSKQVLRRYLEASIISTIAIKRLCSRIEFCRSVLHHGIYVPQGVFAESLMKLKIPIVTWHVAYRKGTFMFSHDGTYHRTLMNEPVSSWENLEWTEELDHQIIKYLNSRWYGSEDWIHFHRNSIYEKDFLYKEIGINKEKPFVLLLTNVMWDAQLHYPNNAFDNMLGWIKHSIRWFIQHPELQLVIRVHPAEVTGTLPSRQLVVEEIKKEFGVLPSNIFVIGPNNSVSTYILAEDCNAAIIYGTKTGVELAAKGIPVIVAGEAWIRNKGVTIDVSSPEQYDSILERLPLKKRMEEEKVLRAKKYAYHFFFRRMIPLNFVEIPKGSSKPFNFKIDNVEELGPNHHKGLDVICDGITNGSPFVYKKELE